MNKSVIQISELRKLGTLEWLPAGGLDHLAMNIKEEYVSKGQPIYRPGQPAKFLYYVLDGAVGIAMLGSEDRFVRLILSTKGEFFGIDAVMRKGRRLTMATALQDSRVGRIEARVFVTEICGVPWEPFSGLIDILVGMDRKACLQRAMFLVENLPDRLALALWQYGNGFSGASESGFSRHAEGVLPAALTHDELAAIVGASRPRVSVALKQLERRGLLVRRGKRIRIQEKRLRIYLEDRYGFVF